MGRGMREMKKREIEGEGRERERERESMESSFENFDVRHSGALWQLQFR